MYFEKAEQAKNFYDVHTNYEGNLDRLKELVNNNSYDIKISEKWLIDAKKDLWGEWEKHSVLSAKRFEELYWEAIDEKVIVTDTFRDIDWVRNDWNYVSITAWWKKYNEKYWNSKDWAFWNLFWREVWSYEENKEEIINEAKLISESWFEPSLLTNIKSISWESNWNGVIAAIRNVQSEEKWLEFFKNAASNNIFMALWLLEHWESLFDKDKSIEYKSELRTPIIEMDDMKYFSFVNSLVKSPFAWKFMAWLIEIYENKKITIPKIRLQYLTRALVKNASSLDQEEVTTIFAMIYEFWWKELWLESINEYIDHWKKSPDEKLRDCEYQWNKIANIIPYLQKHELFDEVIHSTSWKRNPIIAEYMEWSDRESMGMMFGRAKWECTDHYVDTDKLYEYKKKLFSREVATVKQAIREVKSHGIPLHYPDFNIKKLSDYSNFFIKYLTVNTQNHTLVWELLEMHYKIRPFDLDWPSSLLRVRVENHPDENQNTTDTNDLYYKLSNHIERYNERRRENRYNMNFRGKYEADRNPLKWFFIDNDDFLKYIKDDNGSLIALKEALPKRWERDIEYLSKIITEIIVEFDWSYEWHKIIFNTNLSTGRWIDTIYLLLYLEMREKVLN